MSKIVLFVIGIALIGISANYFVSIGSLGTPERAAIQIEQPSTQTSSVLSVSGAFASDKSSPVVETSPVKIQEPSTPKNSPPKPDQPNVIPVAKNPADSLRSALENVVDESIEQELLDERKLKSQTLLDKN